jgi:hypothetical protein
MRYDEISRGGQHHSEVYLDMDGVLADFFVEYAKLAGIESGNYRDIPPAKTDPTLNKMIGTDFFARLPKFPTADRLVAMVVKVFGHYNICSSPLRGDHANSEKQKKIWIQEHLDPQPVKIIITPQKQKYAVQPDGTPNVLIDDRGSNITAWEAAGGVGIKYQADEDGLEVIVQGLRRAVDIIRGEREHDPQQLISKDRSLPVATDRDKVEESLYVDVPNEEWLDSKISWAKKKGRNSFGVPYLGSVTARPTEDYFHLPVKLLKSLPGMRDEQRNVRSDDLKAIMQIMKDTGKLPLMSNGKEYRPFINVAWNGEAWVNEGNHRIMAAAALGWDSLPVELRYFDGGERVKSGPLYPPKIGLGDPLDENWKKAVATGALAAATALGTPAAAGNLPDLVAVVTMNIDGKTVTKEINLGNDYPGPTEAAQAIDKFMANKGIKNYSVDIQRVPSKSTNENFIDGKVNSKINFTVQSGGNKFANTMTVDGEPAGVYQYNADTGRSIAEVYPEYRGKGLGKVLVLHAIYTATKLGMDFIEDESRTSEYDNVLDSLSDNGYIVDDDGYWYVTSAGEQFLKDSLNENFADGKVKGKSRPGRVKRAGASCKGSVSDLRARAKKYGGEKGRMYHWCANMKGGKK